MKKHVSNWFQQALVALFLVSGIALYAQPGGGGRDMNPEKRAEQQTAQMKEQLGLSDAQTAKVQDINLKYAKQAQEAREKADGDWEAARGKMAAMRQEQDKELQTVVTQEQWQKWVAFREEQRNNRGNWGGGGNRPDGAKPAQDRKQDMQKDRAKDKKKSKKGKSDE